MYLNMSFKRYLQLFFVSQRTVVYTSGQDSRERPGKTPKALLAGPHHWGRLPELRRRGFIATLGPQCVSGVFRVFNLGLQTMRLWPICTFGHAHACRMDMVLFAFEFDLHKKMNTRIECGVASYRMFGHLQGRCAGMLKSLALAASDSSVASCSSRSSILNACKKDLHQHGAIVAIVRPTCCLDFPSRPSVSKPLGNNSLSPSSSRKSPRENEAFLLPARRSKRTSAKPCAGSSWFSTCAEILQVTCPIVTSPPGSSKRPSRLRAKFLNFLESP